MPNDLLYQLLQQGPQAAPPPEIDANGMDASEAAMMPQASVPVGKTGGLKARLTNALSAMSDSLLHSAGVETPDQKASRAAEDQQRMAATAHLQAQTKQMGEEVDTPLGRMPNALWKTIGPAMIKAQSGQAIQEMKGKAQGERLDSAESMNNARIDAQKEIAKSKIEAAMNKASMLAKAPGGGIGALTAQEKDALIEGLHEGTLDVRSFGRMSGPQRMQLLAATKIKYPDFDQTKFAARQGLQSDFAKGKGAENIKSYRAFLGHAEDLSDFSDDFTRLGSKLANKPIMWLRQNASSDPNVSAFLAKIDPVKKEFESFLLNNRALYESDRKTADLILSENMPAAQMKSAITSFVHTGAIRMKSVNQQYKDTMGKDHPTMIDPDTKRILNKFGQGDMTGGGQPKIGDTKTFPNGAKGKWDGKGWVAQ